MKLAEDKGMESMWGCGKVEHGATGRGSGGNYVRRATSHWVAGRAVSLGITTRANGWRGPF
jgi:hypothetical protein